MPDRGPQGRTSGKVGVTAAHEAPVLTGSLSNGKGAETAPRPEAANPASTAAGVRAPRPTVGLASEKLLLLFAAVSVVAELIAATVFDLSAAHLSLWLAGTVSVTVFLALLLPLLHRTLLAPAQAALTRQAAAEAELSLWASVFRLGREAMTITGRDGSILAVNPAFTRITGYSPEEVYGKNPRILQSGLQGRDFYRQMWAELLETGHWQGEIWNRRKDGTVYPELLTINVIRDADGEVLWYVGIFSDITQQKRLSQEVWKRSNFDSLTGLPNRHLFLDRMEQEMRRFNRTGQVMALIVLDLDRFSDVNNTLGTEVGDYLLKRVGQRLRDVVPANENVARLDGDEFGVVMSHLQATEEAGFWVGRILRAFSDPFECEGETAWVTASIGVTLYPDDAARVDDLLRHASQALAAAKKQGRNRSCYYNSTLQEASIRRLRLAAGIRSALTERQFQVHFQPLIDLKTGKVCKAEALARWQHPEFGRVSPAEFIPIAEETGLIDEISHYVFHEALGCAARWCRLCPDFQISMNLSPLQLKEAYPAKAGWIEFISAFQLPPGAVMAEITEGLLLEAGETIGKQLKRFRRAGVEIAIDDFGTGYASFGYLKNFEVDYLKVDRSFVAHLEQESPEMAICEAIIVMSHKLGVKVIAEGIETAEQLALLKAAGCDYGQGYQFARPMPAEEFEKLLQAEAAPVAGGD